MKKVWSQNANAAETFPVSAAGLRRDISSRNLLLAEAVPHELTFGAVASVIYQEVGGAHGNFLPASYRRICARPAWRRRLLKVYTASARVPRSKDRIRRELDCANSSDALLMNVFCYPGVTHRRELSSLLGIEPGQLATTCLARNCKPRRLASVWGVREEGSCGMRAVS